MGQQKQRIDLTGQPFGDLIVLRYAGNSKWGEALWECQCQKDGNITVVIGNSLRRGLTKSCGCQAGSGFGSNNHKYQHGHAGVTKTTRRPEYQAWLRMKDRCNNKNCKDYPDYGGRGITVCDRWLESYENFLKDMGFKPEPKRQYSLERIDNNKGYAPENCKWATHQEQARNRRTRRCPHCKKPLYNERYAKD